MSSCVLTSRWLLAGAVVVTLEGVALAQTPGVSPASGPSDHEVVATPEAQKEGREHFARGLALYREGNFGGARVEFQRAYDVAPSYRILFNLAESAFELQDYAGAMTAFSRYLAEGGDRLPASRRADVEKSLRDLELRIGRVEITTDLPGAEVAVDGVNVGKSPLVAPIVVSVGRRTVTATLSAHVPAISTIDVAGGDHATVRLSLPAVALPSSAPVVVVAPQLEVPLPVQQTAPVVKPHPPSWTPVWIGLGATGALVVGTAVFGALTVGANGTLNTQLGELPGSPSRIASARSNVHTYGVVTDILGGAAIVGAGATLYLALTRKPAAPTVGFGPGTVTLSGQF